MSGYAKLPTNITAETVYDTLVIAVLFDKRSGIIVEAEASMVTDLAKRFVSQILVGYNLNDGPEELMASFEKYYHGHAKKALETATKMVFNKYQDFLAEQKS